MSIIRAARPQSNFYILDKRISEDRGLSWAARGLLIFLLGKPDHWKVSVEHLRKETQASAKPSGRDAIYAMLTELIKSGYVKRDLSKSDGGQLAGYDYYVFDEPVTLGDSEDAPCTAFPDTAEPDTVEPYTANPTLVSTDHKQVKNKARTEKKPDASASFSVLNLTADGLSEELAYDFMIHRKRLKAPMTERAWNAIKREAAIAGWTLDAVICRCLEKGWRSFEAEWVMRNSNRATGKQAEWDSVIAEFARGGKSDDPYTIDMEYVS